jgi:polysaccharide deacetylase family protein (PEP-CTERM system associated)
VPRFLLRSTRLNATLRGVRDATRSDSRSDSTVRVEPAQTTLHDGPRHALTVDVEDWYQSCVDYDAPITERVVRNVDRMLTVFADCETLGTFFVQGLVAERFPGVVTAIAEAGHEVQVHGHTHRPLHAMGRDELREEVERAKLAVESALGAETTMFRAPDFSIGSGNLWAIEVLADLGFTVDSSIFPTRTAHYGIANWHLGPHYLVLEDGRRLLEVPVTVWELGRVRVPIGGGGYFRLLPRPILERGFRAAAAAGRPGVAYCHPYEFAPDELRSFGDVSRRMRLHQSLGRRRAVERMRALLGTLPFGSLGDVIRGLGLAALTAAAAC